MGLMGGSLALKILMLTSLSTYFIVGLIHGELHHVCLTILPYLFALPSFVNIFQIYSMSNLHDVSWGTRPQGTVENAPQIMEQNLQHHPTIIKIWKILKRCKKEIKKISC